MWAVRWIGSVTCWQKKTWKMPAEMSQTKSHEVQHREMRSSAPGEESPCAVQPECQPTGKQLCRGGPGSPGGAAGPAMCPCSRGGQQHPGLQGDGGTLPLCSALRRHRWVQCWAPATETGTCWRESNELRWLKDQSICHMRAGWESWDCLGLSREGSGGS